MTPADSPVTEAGRALSRANIEARIYRDWFDGQIAAIEQEAAAAALEAVAVKVEGLRPTPGVEGVSGWFFDGYDECRSTVLKLLRGGE